MRLRDDVINVSDLLSNVACVGNNAVYNDDVVTEVHQRWQVITSSLTE